MTTYHLIALYAPPLCLGQGGVTPLIISAGQGHSEVVALLCQQGANIEARDDVSRQRYYIIEAIQYIYDMDACMYDSIYQHSFLEVNIFVCMFACRYCMFVVRT